MDASFHTLGHTAAAWMIQAGVTLYEVQNILGHSTPSLMPTCSPGTFGRPSGLWTESSTL